MNWLACNGETIPRNSQKERPQAGTFLLRSFLRESTTVVCLYWSMSMSQQKHIKQPDLNWQRRCDLASKILCAIEDHWLRSDQPFPSRQIVAILLNVFAFDFYRADFLDYKGLRSDDLQRLSLQEWHALVGTPESECAKLSPNRSEAVYHQVVDSLCSILSRTADSWIKHGPSKPPCCEVIEKIGHLLISSRFMIIRRK